MLPKHLHLNWNFSVLPIYSMGQYVCQSEGRVVLILVASANFEDKTQQKRKSDRKLRYMKMPEFLYSHNEGVKKRQENHRDRK